MLQFIAATQGDLHGANAILIMSKSKEDDLTTASASNGPSATDTVRCVFGHCLLIITVYVTVSLPCSSHGPPGGAVRGWACSYC